MPAPGRIIAGFRQGIDRRVASLCLVIFVADVVAGVVAPTFSPYAQGLGLSLAALGALNTLGGATQFLVSAPLGILSDRLGRTGVITGGLIAFALTMTLFMLADGAPLLVAGRMLQGLAVVACFQIGAAYLGDITPPGRRAVAFGAFTTAMGLGFTTGPLLGGLIADRWSTRASYVAGALLALGGAVLAHLLLRDAPSEGRRATTWYSGIRDAMRRNDLLVVSFGNLLINVTFAGSISTFFALYARDAGLGAATVGTLFAVRAFVSALGRLPNSVVTRLVGDQPVLLGAMAIQAAVLFGIAWSERYWLLASLLALEGLAYGAYLVAGQTWVADHTEAATRGAAVGLYGSFGSLGGIIAPLAFGLVADRYAVRMVFLVNGWLMLAGLAVAITATVLISRAGMGETGPPA